jgi:hypothetical protein
MAQESQGPGQRVMAAATSAEPQYLMAARTGGFKGGLIGGLIGSVITLIVCFVCHYMLGM